MERFPGRGRPLNEMQREAAATVLAKASRTLEAARNAIAHDFFDDASSRAYYAAFHAVTAALASRGLSFSSHGQVMGAFNREFVKTGRSSAESFQKIKRLFEHRQVGDYSATMSIDRQTAEQDVADAQWLIAECKRLIDAQ
jgi:uncharacterized protein (UPF0332 family)